MTLPNHSHWKRCVFIFSIICCCSLPAISQELNINGIVTDEKNEILPGVGVNLKGTTKGTVTDDAGRYQIVVQGKQPVLIFSLVGYELQEVPVGNTHQINIVLKQDIKTLDEAVVIGYGTQKNSRVTSSVARITANDLDERPTSRIDNAMVGKLSGVQVQEISGSPGKSLTVKVRGVGSISNSTAPLYVVDGYPISSGLDNINPNDIASIDVLKDAASAAIYGSRGSNGVVLVTTKSGKAGKPVLRLDAYYGLQKLFSKVDMLNKDEYINFAIEERNNSWVLQGGKVDDPNSVRPSQYWIDPLWLSDPTSLPDNDWQELISRVAPVQNYELSASGSEGKTKYYLSGNYFGQQGIILGSDYNRLSFLTKIETKINDRINVGLNLSAASVTKKDSDGDGNAGPVLRTYAAPTLGLHQQTQKGGYNPYYAAFYINPLALSTELTNKTNTVNFRANLFGSVDLAKNLRFRTSIGTDYLSSLNQYFLPDDINRGKGDIGRVATSALVNYLNENTLIYDFEQSGWALNALAGFTYQEEKLVNTSLSKTGFPDDEITTLNMGTILSAGSSSATQWNLMSFLGRANLSWEDKYLVSASIRRDGSSRFGADNRWGWFPAVSVGWRLSKEKFFEGVSTINELKLRGSYGVAGNNNIGNYAAIGTLSSTNYVLGAAQSVISGFAPGSFSNRKLGWEKTYTLDAGIDIGILGNRIVLGFDYYNSNTRDILLSLPIPTITGFSSAQTNIGSVRNSGVELELNTVNLNGKLKWNTGFNISHNKNIVTSLGPGNAPIIQSLSGFQFITEVGQPIGSYYAFLQDGVFKDQKDFDSHPHYKTQNVGDIKYKDINGDGVINEDDRTILGNNNPKFFWGLQNTFSYNNFDLNISMDGQWGNKLLNTLKVSDGQSRTNVGGYWRDRWRSPEDPGNGWVPRAAVTANLATPSSFWLRSAAFWRVRTISLGYRFENFSKRLLGITGLRIYTSIDNVYMHDDYNHNPQTGTYSNSNTMPGVDFDSTYPLATTYTFGFNLKF